jgi:hypothetical protein
MIGSILFGAGCFLAGVLFGPLVKMLIAKKAKES